MSGYSEAAKADQISACQTVFHCSTCLHFKQGGITSNSLRADHGMPELQSGLVDTVDWCAGVHVTLPDYYSPEHLGMIVPKTKDGRVVFMLPWVDATIAVTTGNLVVQQGSIPP